MKFGIGQPVRRYRGSAAHHRAGPLHRRHGAAADDAGLRAALAGGACAISSASMPRRRGACRACCSSRPGEDVRADGLGDVPCTVPLMSRDGKPRHDTPRPVLALGKVRHVGQPVALVVAETLAAARDAAEAIEVEYDALPAVTDAQGRDRRPARRSCSTHIPGNIVFDWDNDMGDAKATDAAFAKAARVVALELVNNRVVVNSMEPRNAIADYDPASGRSTLYTATQGPHFVRDPLAEIVLKMPKDKLRLITPNVGGGFGMKAFVYPEHALVVWASRKIARPVKWQEDRSEGFVSDNQGRDHVTRAELALDAQGPLPRPARLDPRQSRRLSVAVRLLRADALDRSGLRPLCDRRDPHQRQGRVHQHRAGLRLSRRRAARGRLSARAPGRCRGARARHEPRRHPPHQFRAAVGHALHLGDQARARFRRVRKGDGPVHGRRRNGRHSPSGASKASATASCAASAWRPIPSAAAAAFPRPRRSNSRTTSVELVMGNQEYGTGLVTAYKQIVSDQLGIDADRIDVIMGDTDRTPSGLTGGSRALAVAGTALYEAGKTIIDKGTQLAAHLLEVSAQDVAFADGDFQRARHRSAPRSLRRGQGGARSGETAGRHGARPRHHAHVRVPPAQTFPNGCHIVEVEIDPDTGAVDDRALHRGRRFRPHHQSAAARRPGPRRHRAGHRPGAARARGL